MRRFRRFRVKTRAFSRPSGGTNEVEDCAAATTVARASRITSMQAVTQGVYSLRLRNRNAFAITETELRLMAAPVSTRTSSRSRDFYSHHVALPAKMISMIPQAIMNNCLSLRVSAVASMLLAVVAMPISAQTARQEHVHQMSHGVMPFDISKTIHIFKMTEQGGVLRVVTREPDSGDQVPLIQQHLQHEAEQFQKGNYSDLRSCMERTCPG